MLINNSCLMTVETKQFHIPVCPHRSYFDELFADAVNISY